MAIAATTYATACLLHEGVGHQLFCGAGGGRPQGFSVANAGCLGADSPSGHRWEQAGGGMMVGPWLSVGDWGDSGVFRDVRRPLAGKIAVTTAGLLLTAATILIRHGLGKPLVGEDRQRLVRSTAARSSRSRAAPARSSMPQTRAVAPNRSASAHC